MHGLTTYSEVAQRRRVEEGTAIAGQWWASLFPRINIPISNALIRPAEGWLPPGSAARQVDPLGLARTRHDLPPGLSVEDYLKPETDHVRAVFERRELADSSKDYRETLYIDRDNAEPLVVRVQNIVHTNYCDTNPRLRELDSDEESAEGQGKHRRHRTGAAADAGAYRRHHRAADDGGDDDAVADYFKGIGADGSNDSDDEEHSDTEADAGGGGGDNDGRLPGENSTPVFFSLRLLQRKWLGMGFHKNRVGTAVGLRFARPWSCSHLVFPKGRVLGTGTNNRVVDRLLLKYATCAYMRKAGVASVALKRRTSQNFVAKCQLPTQTGLCLGRLCQQLKDRAKPTKRFTGIVVHWKPATLLLFQYGSMICIGTNSIRQLREAITSIAPVVTDNFRTPENEEQEQALLRCGALRGFPIAQLKPLLSTWHDKTETARRSTNEARRKPKVRFMGGY